MELRRLTTLAIDGFLEAPSGDFDEDICCVDSCRTRDSKLSYAASCLFSCLLSFKAE